MRTRSRWWIFRRRTAAVDGFIPTGWYPTASRALADGRLLVLNGRGLRSYPNPEYAGPRQVSNVHQGDPRGAITSASMQTGTMSVIDPFTDETLDRYTQTAQSLSPYKDSDLDVSSFPTTT